VDRALVDGQRRLVNSLGQCRMCMHDTGDVFRRSLELHRDDAFGNQFGHAGADHVDTQDAIGFRMRQHLDHAVRVRSWRRRGRWQRTGSCRRDTECRHP
jgi:hypothetical protein